MDDDFVTKINANVDDFYADTISYEVFRERAKALWVEIENAGVVDQVRKLVMPPMGAK